MSKSGKKYNDETKLRKYIDKKSCHSKSRNKDKELNRRIMMGNWDPTDEYDYGYDEDNY